MQKSIISCWLLLLMVALLPWHSVAFTPHPLLDVSRLKPYSQYTFRHLHTEDDDFVNDESCLSEITMTNGVYDSYASASRGGNANRSLSATRTNTTFTAVVLDEPQVAAPMAVREEMPEDLVRPYARAFPPHPPGWSNRRRLDPSQETPTLLSTSPMTDLASSTLGDIMSSTISPLLPSLELTTSTDSTIRPVPTNTTSELSGSLPYSAATPMPTATRTTTSASPASSFTSLASLYNITHPLDRLALTANGNLQRLVSSYYDAPVHVVVDSCNLIAPGVWDRRVHLTVTVASRTIAFAQAHSRIRVYDPVCQALVTSQQVGLGQLFRYLDCLPHFTLHGARKYTPLERTALWGSVQGTGTQVNRETWQNGGNGGGGFWRNYTLSCPDMVLCQIREDFLPGMWDLQSL
jgi:hypothetical protein